ncbi:MAG: hypothetical protein EBX41_04710 [Chitinophagia bacterium]|nr:hypothetical protein [Chitinophagia bacterium]
MKQALFVFAILLLTSCKNTWTEEDKTSWMTACEDNAKHDFDSPEKSQVYCECVLNKMMAKYPKINDALEHLPELMNDTALTNCKQMLQK